jgi:hypothetical protein
VCISPPSWTRQAQGVEVIISSEGVLGGVAGIALLPRELEAGAGHLLGDAAPRGHGRQDAKDHQLYHAQDPLSVTFCGQTTLKSSFLQDKPFDVVNESRGFLSTRYGQPQIIRHVGIVTHNDYKTMLQI